MRSVSKLLFRAALLLPALCLLLSPGGAQARDRDHPESEDRDALLLEEEGTGGRAGVIDEFNFGPPGPGVLQREGRLEEGDTRLLSGRVVELKNQILYVERNGVVVPLDLRALRITQQPQEGQEVIASYVVDRTSNVALSLEGEVEPQAD
jgi:hypothetical protein